MAKETNKVEANLIARIDRGQRPPGPIGPYGASHGSGDRIFEQNTNSSSANPRIGLHPLFVRWLEPTLALAEGGRAGQAVALDNGASGLSLGRLQMDLSQQAELRVNLAAFARARLLDLDTPGPDAPAVRVDIERLFAKTTEKMNKAERAQAERIGMRLLAWPGAAAILARFERLKLVRIGLAVRRVIATASPGAAKFARSLRGQIEFGCHLHQFGTGSTERLEAFLAGRTVAFEGADGKMRSVAPTIPLDIERFRDFRRATRWGAANPRANESRHQRIDLALKGTPGDA
ncbi:MAG: hypothetical protein O9320_14745 [Magnetospirillum sp.]|nr:hypothetical protein [Magnetospirillum sp.]